VGSAIKTLIFVGLLVGAGCFMGFVCQRIAENYELLFSPSIDLLYLGLWFFGAAVAVAITAGLAALLLRPFALVALAFALSALGLLLLWEFSVVSGIVAGAFFLVGLLFSSGVIREVNSRIKFSVFHMMGSQAILLVVVTAIACAGLYAGYADEIEREGFALPPAIVDVITDALEDTGMTPAQIQVFEQQIETTVAPYESYIPIGLAAIVFLPLSTVVLLLSWIPLLLLALKFLLLRHFAVVGEVTETVEVTRFSLHKLEVE